MEFIQIENSKLHLCGQSADDQILSDLYSGDKRWQRSLEWYLKLATPITDGFQPQATSSGTKNADSWLVWKRTLDMSSRWKLETAIVNSGEPERKKDH